MLWITEPHTEYSHRFTLTSIYYFRELRQLNGALSHAYGKSLLGFDTFLSIWYIDIALV